MGYNKFNNYMLFQDIHMPSKRKSRGRYSTKGRSRRKVGVSTKSKKTTKVSTKKSTKSKAQKSASRRKTQKISRRPRRQATAKELRALGKRYGYELTNTQATDLLKAFNPKLSSRERVRAKDRLFNSKGWVRSGGKGFTMTQLYAVAKELGVSDAWDMWLESSKQDLIDRMENRKGKSLESVYEEFARDYPNHSLNSIRQYGWRLRQ